MKRFIVTMAILAWAALSAGGAETDPRAENEAAIRQAVEAYVAAFNQADAKALAALWSPEAVYTNPLSGEQATGREAIEKQFTEIFGQAQGAKLEAQTEAIQFISPNVAVEQGTAKVLRPDQPPEESEYTAVYVKRDGQWLLDRVTEEDIAVPPSHYEQLKELEWMIGSWVDQDDENRIESTCQWTKNENFIIQWFTVSVHERINLSGVQVIGWDPAAKQIRSWVFDSDGGFGGGTWTKKDNRWQIQASGVLPDGSKTSAVNVMTAIDADTFTWQSINREAGGEILPNVDEVVVVRQETE